MHFKTRLAISKKNQLHHIMYDSGNHEDMSRAHNFSRRRGNKLIDIKMTMHDNKQSMCDIILIRVM